MTLHHTPFKDAATVDVTALFVQDSYSLRNLTLTGGLRWERLAGYLPEQNSPPSPWFPNLQRNFAEVRDIVLWHTAGPRLSAIYDVTGDGKTAIKASVGRYYYILSTGGGGVSNVNLNSTYNEVYRWNDRNGDLVFQAGEQEGTPVVTSGITTTIDPNFRRPYTDEYSAGVDRELIPNLKLSTVFTYRRSATSSSRQTRPIRTPRRQARPSIRDSTAWWERPTTGPTSSSSACRRPTRR